MVKKRVLIVVNYFFPYVSGVSEYARAIAANLAKHHDVTVLTGKHKTDLPDEQQFEGYTLIRANPLFFLDKGYISTDFVVRFRQLAHQSDVINLHLPMLESGLLSMLTSRPLLATYHCDMALVGGPLSRLAVLGVQLSMRLALARAKAVVVLSEDYAMSSPIAKAHRHKIFPIVPPNRFEDTIGGPLSPCKSENLICGFVGRFVQEKGIDVIIDAARILKDQAFEFWLAGDYLDVAGGSVYEKLKVDIESLGGKIRLLGRLTNDQLIEFYQKIDVLLLPSTNRFEAFGMVQMEAMSFGATVVTSDMPGVRETVRRTEIGQLCVPGSGQSLAEAIQRAHLERQNVSREQAQAAVRRVFGNIKFVNGYLELIEKLSGGDFA
jgi:glycosyltransferase involved in cell wall biosynthesis